MDMLPNRNHDSQWKPILYYIGMVVAALGAMMFIPVAVSLLYREWTVAVNFTLSGSITVLLGCTLLLVFGKYRGQRLGWGEGMTVTAGAWFAGMLVCALPYALSGNYQTYLDSCFDVMSGFTTTGLTLIQDMDHLANGVNMWRHLLTFVGGQGMVVLVLTVMTRGSNGMYKMYVGEGKDERLMPNVIHTARAIWQISMTALTASLSLT